MANSVRTQWIANGHEREFSLFSNIRCFPTPPYVFSSESLCLAGYCIMNSLRGFTSSDNTIQFENRQLMFFSWNVFGNGDHRSLECVYYEGGISAGDIEIPKWIIRSIGIIWNVCVLCLCIRWNFEFWTLFGLCVFFVCLEMFLICFSLFQIIHSSPTPVSGEPNR